MNSFKRKNGGRQRRSDCPKPPFYRIVWEKTADSDFRPALFLMREGLRLSQEAVGKIIQEAAESDRVVLGVFCPDIARSKMAVAEAAARLHKLPFPFLLKRE